MKSKLIIFILIVICCSNGIFAQQDFLSQQKTYGSCVTIGCLPMTDDKIKEIYLYAVFARNNGQNNIPVYIFPFRMTDNNFQTYKKRYSKNQELIDFWANLKIGYDKFLSEKKLLNETVDKSGDYQF